MAGSFQTFEASDLTLGKPALHWLPTSATVCDALKALKEYNVREISVWNCSADSDNVALSRSLTGVKGGSQCRDSRCVGKVNAFDVICYLARGECLQKYESAVLDPLSVLLAATPHSVKQVDSRTRLCDVFSLMLEGAQYLVVPLDSPRFRNLKHTQASRKTGQYNLKTGASLPGTLLSKRRHQRSHCWLTQEDVLRFLLGWIGVFSSLSMKSIENLGIINTDFLFVDVNAKASSALPLMHQASQSLSAVAVVEGSCTFQQGPKLVGEISLSTLKYCDQSAALAFAIALATFSVKDFLSFTQRGSFSKGVKDFTKFRHTQKTIAANLFSAYATDDVSLNSSSQEAFDCDLGEVSSSDESLGSCLDESSVIPKKSWSIAKEHTSPITCHPWSSLVAVMAQTLAHRTSYVWVTDNNRMLIGIVTYQDIIQVLLNHLDSSE